MADIEQIDRVEAMRRAETIRSGMVGYAMAMQAIGEAYEARDWVALGHKDWDTYCEKEFSEKRLKLTRDQREQAVLAFRGAGMSIRAIGSVLGVSPGTVHSDLAGVQDRTPDTVIGADGKSYAASRPVVSSDSPKTPSGGVPEEGAPVSGAPAGPVAVPAEDGSGTQSTPADPPIPPDADGDAKDPVRAGDDAGQPEQDHRDAIPGEAEDSGPEGGPSSEAVGAPTPAATQTDPAEGSPQDSNGSVDGRERPVVPGVSAPAALVPKREETDEEQQAREDREYREARSLEFATGVVNVRMRLEPDPVRWYRDVYIHGLYHARDLPRVRDSFTPVGLRQAALFLEILAEHLEKTGEEL